MSKLSTLGSPGVEVREIDNSTRVDVDPSTTYFIPGFAAQGPVEEVHSIGSMADFENIYGVPTNEAERYFYHTVKSIIDNTGSSTKVYVSRLPYGPNDGDTVSNAFTLLSYPAVPIIKKSGKEKESLESYKVTNEDTIKELLSLSLSSTNEETNTVNETTDGEGDVPEEEENDIMPDKVDYDLIIDENYILGEDENIISLNKITIEDENGKESTLPDLNNLSSFKSKIFLSYSFDKEKNESTDKPDEEIGGETGDEPETVSESPIEKVEGNIALEKIDGKTLVIHTAFNIVKGDKKIGVLVLKAEYENWDVNKKTDQYVFASEGVAAKMELNEIYEVATSYDGQSAEQLKDGNYDTSKFAKDITYLIGAPTTFHISLDQYYKIITGDGFKWSRRPYDMSETPATTAANESSNITGSNAAFAKFDALSHSAFIVLNTSRSIINDSFEGFYFGMCDNMFVTPSSDYIYDAIRRIKVTTDVVNLESDDAKGLVDSMSADSDFDNLGENRLGFYLTDNHSGSISKIMERGMTQMDISSTEYDDTISLGLFKLSKTVNANATLKLDYTIREKYNASIGKSRLKTDASASKPISYFVENITENSSNLIFLVNPYISEKIYMDLDGVLHCKARVFGNKLINNLDTFEKKYLIDNISSSNNYGDSRLIAPIKLARSSVESYKSIVAQAGVSPYFIKKTFNINENTSKTDYKYFVKGDVLYPFGVYSNSKNSSKIIGNLPAKLERALDLVKNDEEYTKIDIIPEGGLGTIYVYSNSAVVVGESISDKIITSEEADGKNGLEDDDSISKQLFDSSIILRGIEDLRTGRSSLSDEAQNVIDDYLAVIQKFYNFCNSQTNGGRGDSFFIGDVLRGILIKGKDTKVGSLFGSKLENNMYENGDGVNHSFSTSIFYPIKHIFDSVVSSYGSTYAQWVKILDNASSEKVWIPISGYVAAMMGRSDAQSGPWLAAAGLNRGVISALDCAYSPNQDQRTDLYKICINSVPKIPNKGITIFGIRTMSKKASAFDQNTCRRTFLYMENTIKRYMRNYIFEPNTPYTRLQIVNDIEPFLENVATSGGLYSWTCVCDSSNNTPDIINNGDMAVDIAASPTRTAENIILNFTANKYTSDVSNVEN